MSGALIPLRTRTSELRPCAKLTRGGELNEEWYGRVVERLGIDEVTADIEGWCGSEDYGVQDLK